MANGVTVSQGLTNAGKLNVGATTATITGDYTQLASGTLALTASSKTNYGVLAVSGAAALPSAANIFVNVAGNNTIGNKQTLTGVLTSSDLTASTFNVTDNSDLITFKGLIDGNDVDLVASYNALVLPAVLANKNIDAVGAATVLDQILLQSGTGNSPFNSVFEKIAALPNSAAISRAASQTLPVLSGESNVATYAAMSQLNQMVQSRIAGDYGLSSGDYYLNDRNVWVKPVGSWADLGDEGGVPGFTASVEGVAFGADGALSDRLRVGVGFAYANADVSGNSNAAPNNDRIDLYQLMGYGSFAIDPRTSVNFELDGGVNSNSANRNIEFLHESATSSFNSSDAHFGIGIGRDIPVSASTVFTPYARVDYSWVSNDSYSEGGAGPLSLNVRSASFESLLTQIGVKGTQKVNDLLTVFANFGYGYDSMAHDQTTLVSAFSGAPGLSFGTQGVGLKPQAILGGFGAVSSANGNMPELSLKYDIQQRSGFSDQSVSFKARWAF
jgi:uncharacterized protein with beta-barrel porin domain